MADVLRFEMITEYSFGKMIFPVGTEINWVRTKIRSLRLAPRSGGAERFLRRGQ